MNWLNTSIKLYGAHVELLPLTESYFSELTVLAQDKRIWEFIPNKMDHPVQCINQFNEALIHKAAFTQMPFVIYHHQQQKLIGSTRLMNIDAKNRKLEIGWTWLHPNYWATSINFECKLLLLTYCFEELKAIRVQLKTDERNIRSQKAIQKIGAQFEGILRNDMIRDDGTYRNSAYYSITEDQWGQVKENLLKKLNDKKYVEGC